MPFDPRFMIDVMYPAATSAYLMMTVHAPPLPAGYTLVGAIEADPRAAVTVAALTDAKLHEIAAKHVALLKNAEALPTEDAVAQGRKAEAIAAITAGEYGRAEKILQMSFDAELSAAKRAQSEADQKFLTAAQTEARLGELQEGQRKYAAASATFREAASIVPAHKPILRAEYLSRAASMLNISGRHSDAMTTPGDTSSSPVRGAAFGRRGEQRTCVGED